jgi:hypothetical protein
MQTNITHDLHLLTYCVIIPDDILRNSVAETAVLEEEARSMENRLKMLQERVQQQQLADEALLKPGGSRWGSARADKGTIHTYAKDVQEKHKKRSGTKGVDAVMKATADGRRTIRATAPIVDYQTKGISVHRQ